MSGTFFLTSDVESARDLLRFCDWLRFHAERKGLDTEDPISGLSAFITPSYLSDTGKPRLTISFHHTATDAKEN